MRHNVETITIERTPSLGGKARGSFQVDIWQSSEGWHWRLTRGKGAPSIAYGTREAALKSARARDGLDPNV